MSENRKKFADYPEVADAIAGREEKVTGQSQTVAKKGSKKVKIQKEEWRRINALSAGGVSGIPSVAVKCVDIRRNTGGEGGQLGFN